MPNIRRLIKIRPGATLVEVLVGAMVLLMMATAVSSLLLSTFGASKTGQTRYQVALASKKLREQLKAYVTEDTSVLLNAPGNPPWHLPEDTSCESCWALEDGMHDATGLLPDGLREDHAAKMRYAVTSESYRGRRVKKVRIIVDWEPL